jgi:hypothetical protein
MINYQVLQVVEHVTQGSRKVIENLVFKHQTFDAV